MADRPTTAEEKALALELAIAFNHTMLGLDRPGPNTLRIAQQIADGLRERGVTLTRITDDEVVKRFWELKEHQLDHLGRLGAEDE